MCSVCFRLRVKTCRALLDYVCGICKLLLLLPFCVRECCISLCLFFASSLGMHVRSVFRYCCRRLVLEVFVWRLWQQIFLMEYGRSATSKGGVVYVQVPALALNTMLDLKRA